MSQSTARARVVIIEDNQATLKLLANEVKSEPTLELVATFDHANSALSWLNAKKESIDLLLTDLYLPDGSGIDVILACKANFPNCKIMVNTVSSEQKHIVDCIFEGARSYVLKDDDTFDIVRSLLELHAGKSSISPQIASTILEFLQNQNKSTGERDAAQLHPEVNLTKVEMIILKEIARGYSYKKVASNLSKSISTVKTRVSHIYEKLAVHSRVEAVIEAQQRGLL